MKTSAVLAVIAAAVILITCTQGEPESASTMADDMITVSRMLVSLDRIAAEADVDEFLTYVSDDAVMMPPDELAVVGKRAISDWYATLYANYTVELKHDPLETDIFGDIIVHRGNASFTATPIAGGQPISQDNKYLMVIKKQPDGSLKIWRVVFNSNAPPVPGT
jgi:ketosteroid isomerase-like protein